MNTDVLNAHGGLEEISDHVWLRVGYKLKIKVALLFNSGLIFMYVNGIYILKVCAVERHVTSSG